VLTLGPLVAALSQGSSDTDLYPANVSFNPGGNTYIGPVSAVTDGSYDYLFMQGGNSHLYEFNDTNPSSITTTDLTASVSDPRLIVSSPEAIYDGTYLDVFAIEATDSHLVEYSDDGPSDSWQVTDLNAADPGSPLVSGSLTPEFINGVLHVYSSNLANGDLVEIDDDGQFGHSWNFYDETAGAGAGVPIVGAPGAFVANDVPHIYTRAAGSNDLVEYVADHLYGHIWNAYDQTAGTGAPPISGNPIPLLINGVAQVYTNDAQNGDLIEYVSDHLFGHVWNAYDQTASSGAPPLQGDPSVVEINSTTVEVFENASGYLTEVASDHQNGNIWNTYVFGVQIVGDPTVITGELGTVQVFFNVP